MNKQDKSYVKDEFKVLTTPTLYKVLQIAKEDILSLIGKNSRFKVEINLQEIKIYYILKKRNFWFDKKILICKIDNGYMIQYKQIPGKLYGLISKMLKTFWINQKIIFTTENDETYWEPEPWMTDNKKS